MDKSYGGLNVMELTQEYVKEIFDYKDGCLYWKVRLSGCIRIGNKAGGIAKRKNVYRYTVGIKSKRYLRSRIIYLWHKGIFPKVVDHKNRITTDDRIENLRAATYKQNNQNRGKVVKNSSSIYVGVYYDKRRQKWSARVKTSVNQKHMGYFKTEKEAAIAYNDGAKIYHGEFACLNIIN